MASISSSSAQPIPSATFRHGRPRVPFVKLLTGALLVAGLVALVTSHEVTLHPGDVLVGQPIVPGLESGILRCSTGRCNDDAPWYRRWPVFKAYDQRAYGIRHPRVLSGGAMPLIHDSTQGMPVRDAQGREGMARGFLPYRVLVNGVVIDQASVAQLRRVAHSYGVHPGVDGRDPFAVQIGLQEVQSSALHVLQEATGQTTWAWINAHHDAFCDEVQARITERANRLIQQDHPGVSIVFPKPLRFEIFDPAQTRHWEKNQAIDALGLGGGVSYATFQKEFQAGQIGLLVSQFAQSTHESEYLDNLRRSAQKANEQAAKIDQSLDQDPTAPTPAP